MVLLFVFKDDFCEIEMIKLSDEEIVSIIDAHRYTSKISNIPIVYIVVQENEF